MLWLKFSVIVSKRQTEVKLNIMYKQYTIY